MIVVTDASANHWDELGDAHQLRSVGFGVKDISRKEPGRAFLLDIRDAWRAMQAAGAERRDVSFAQHGYVMLIAVRGKLRDLECPWGWEGKKIATFDRTGYNVARAVAHGYRMERSVDIQPWEPWRWAEPGGITRVLEAVDFGVVYVVPGSRMVAMLANNDGLQFGGWGKADMKRVRVFYPWVQTETLNIKENVLGGNNQFSFSDRGESVVMRVSRAFLSPQVEGFANTYRYAQPDYVTDPDYTCFGTGIDYYECVSRNTHYGGQKNAGIWDRKCREHSECEFYDEASGRGGCDASTGYCEFPVGVKGVSYRGYIVDQDRHRPFCLVGEDCSIGPDRKPRGKFHFDGLARRPQEFRVPRNDP